MTRKPSILVVDDEEDFLEIASRKLANEGFEVTVAHTIAAAFAKAKDLMPDLILSDIDMTPGPNGWEFALAVYRDPSLRDIKFAFFTSLHDPAAELPQKDLESDALAALRKIPVFSKTDDMDSLGEKIKSVMH